MENFDATCDELTKSLEELDSFSFKEILSKHSASHSVGDQTPSPRGRSSPPASQPPAPVDTPADRVVYDASPYLPSRAHEHHQEDSSSLPSADYHTLSLDNPKPSGRYSLDRLEDHISARFSPAPERRTVDSWDSKPPRKPRKGIEDLLQSMQDTLERQEKLIEQLKQENRDLRWTLRSREDGTSFAAKDLSAMASIDHLDRHWTRLEEIRRRHGWH